MVNKDLLFWFCMILKPNYIVGFVDGEGTFNLVRYPEGRVRPQFLLFNTYREILESVKETLDLNAPIFEVSRVNDLIHRNKICFRLQVRSREDLRKVIDFFSKYPPIVKRSDFEKIKGVYLDWIVNGKV